MCNFHIVKPTHPVAETSTARGLSHIRKGLQRGQGKQKRFMRSQPGLEISAELDFSFQCSQHSLSWNTRASDLPVLGFAFSMRKLTWQGHFSCLRMYFIKHKLMLLDFIFFSIIRFFFLEANMLVCLSKTSIVFFAKWRSLVLPGRQNWQDQIAFTFLTVIFLPSNRNVNGDPL